MNGMKCIDLKLGKNVNLTKINIQTDFGKI